MKYSLSVTRSKQDLRAAVLSLCIWVYVMITLTPSFGSGCDDCIGEMDQTWMKGCTLLVGLPRKGLLCCIHPCIAVSPQQSTQQPDHWCVTGYKLGTQAVNPQKEPGLCGVVGPGGSLCRHGNDQFPVLLIKWPRKASSTHLKWHFA